MHMAQAAENLRCNICEIAIEVALAKDHSAGEIHKRKKLMLEGDLMDTATRKYAHDSSVVARWATSIHQRL